MSDFVYFDKTLPVFNHLYNSTYLNERGVELAVALDFIDGCDTTNGLEVGNVLGHYDVGGHVVVDPYEPACAEQRLHGWKVQPVDVFDIATEVGSSWDWIVSISTLEHVRFDMDGARTFDSGASLRAIEYLHGLLSPQGRMLVTVPCGYHAELDRLIGDERMGATRSCTMVRDDDGEDIRWRQTTIPLVLPYGRRGTWAESVWIGEYERAA